ncbi:MAG: GatB/YqeY domain-containing protein [Bacteroidales bacterium]|nr:GatB/YqeY domain-containing protein [Bacteroidales bacterium]
MSLQNIIGTALKEAMKAKDKGRLEAIRAIKSELLLAKTAGGANDEVSEEQEIKILQKLVKQRKESAVIYKEQSRDDLAENELNQAAVIEEFLPQQMSDEDLEAELSIILQKLGANSMKDMGKVMGLANQQFKGKADGKRISDFVKKALS